MTMSLRIFENLERLYHEVGSVASSGTVGIVPATGFFHYGVLEMVQRSRSENDNTIVILLDPIEMGQNANFSYEELNFSDREHLIRQGVDGFVLVPKAISNRFIIRESYFGEIMGLPEEAVQAFVTRFLKILVRLRPLHIYWSDLYYRQALILEHLIEDYSPSVKLIRHAITRDSNGIPHASSNSLLSASEKDFSNSFHITLREQFQDCVGLSTQMVTDRITDLLENEGFANVQVRIFDERMSHTDSIGKLSRIFASVTIRDVVIVDNLPVKSEP